MQLIINGETRQFEAPLHVEALLARLGLDGRKVAIERNLEIVPKSTYGATLLADGDRLEIVHFIGGGNAVAEAGLVIAGKRYASRLIVGTGKYKDYAENARALEASGAEIVTVAVRRVNVTDPKQPMLMDFVDPKVDFTALAQSLGMEATRITEPDDIAPALKSAFSRPGAKLIEVVVDGAV